MWLPMKIGNILYFQISFSTDNLPVVAQLKHIYLILKQQQQRSSFVFLHVSFVLEVCFADSYIVISTDNLHAEARIAGTLKTHGRRRNFPRTI